MPILDLRRHRLDVVTACRAADLNVLRLALDTLRRFVPFPQLHVITAHPIFPKFRRVLAWAVELLLEEFISVFPFVLMRYDYKGCSRWRLLQAEVVILSDRKRT